MKKILLAIALAFAVSTVSGLAQDRPERGGGPRANNLQSLTEAERTQFREANRKAATDPAVVAAQEKLQAAQKEAAEARKAAMLKADPNIGPVLEKVEKAATDSRQRRGGQRSE